MYTQGLKRVIAQRSMLQLLLGTTAPRAVTVGFTQQNLMAFSIYNTQMVMKIKITNILIERLLEW
jgi:hypothetical protein